MLAEIWQQLMRVSLWLCSALGHPLSLSPQQSSRPNDDVLAGEDFLSLFYGDKPRPPPSRASWSPESSLLQRPSTVESPDSRFFGEKLAYRKRPQHKFARTRVNDPPSSTTPNTIISSTQVYSPSSFRPTEESTKDDSNQESVKPLEDEKTSRVTLSMSSSVSRNREKPDASSPRIPDVQEVPSPTSLHRSSLNIDETEEFVLGARQEILRVTASPRLLSSQPPSQRFPAGNDQVPKAPQFVNSPEEGARNLDLRKPQSEPEVREAETKPFQFSESSKVGRSESKFQKAAGQFEGGFDTFEGSQDSSGNYYDEKAEGDKVPKSLLQSKSESSAQNLPVLYSEPAKVYSEPAKVYSEPSRVYSEPAKVYSEPAKVYSEPAKVYSEPAKVYSEPAKVYSEPAKVYSEPAKVYGQSDNVFREQEKVFREQENVFRDQEKVFKEQEKSYSETKEENTDVKKENNQAGHVLETSNYKKYRVEEKTSDGFIVGEYGVLGQDGGSLRGVRYTADSDTNPRLIYDALVKFLKLK